MKLHLFYALQALLHGIYSSGIKVKEFMKIEIAMTAVVL